MNAFDSAWLSAHQAKMAVLRGEPIKPPPLLVSFSIPHALKLPNETNGRHWTASHDYKRRLLAMVSDAVKPWSGHQPMPRARVTITRHSVGIADADNITASVKPFLDLLLVRSATHPHSLGLIQDDNPECLELSVHGAKVGTHKEQRTECRIERLEA